MTKLELERYTRFLEDFETIINMDSSSDNLDGVAAVAEYLKDKIVPLGLEVEITRQGPKGVPCLKACTPSKNGRYDFMFLGHMDTVFPTGEAAKRPFSTRDEQAFGPGVNDMQGGLLLAVNTVELLKEEGVLDDIAICLAFNGDEETGSENSRPWIEETSRSCDRVLVFEPARPGYRHVMHRKGGSPVTITAHGVSAHAGADPEKGVNPVVELAYQIGRIRDLNRPGSGITAECTLIHAGEKFNIIPDTATLGVDVRFSTKKEMEEVEAFFTALPDDTLLPGASLEVTISEQRPPLESCPESEALLEILKDEGRKLGIEVDGLATGGCSDGNWTAALGVPTIDGMGPVGENSHRPDEYMQLDSFIPSLTMVANLCKRVVKGE